MPTQDPQPPTGGHVSVDCYVRADAVSDPVEARVDELRGLASDGAVDEYTIRTWPAAVVLSPLTEGTLAVERYRTFRQWAAQWGVSVEPPFRRTTRRSEFTGETQEVLRTPSLCLAVHVDGRLREVFPHTSKETTYDVADALETLAAGVLTVDDSVDVEPVGPRDCPRCDVPLSTGQGLYACPDCRWVGVADDGGIVKPYDLGEPIEGGPEDAEPTGTGRDDAEPSMLRP